MQNEFNFPSMIKAYLEETNITQRKLAETVGISEVTLSRIMTGAAEPSGQVIKKLWPFVYGDKRPTPETHTAE